MKWRAAIPFCRAIIVTFKLFRSLFLSHKFFHSLHFSSLTTRTRLRCCRLFFLIYIFLLFSFCALSSQQAKKTNSTLQCVCVPYVLAECRKVERYDEKTHDDNSIHLFVCWLVQSVGRSVGAFVFLQIASNWQSKAQKFFFSVFALAQCAAVAVIVVIIFYFCPQLPHTIVCGALWRTLLFQHNRAAHSLIVSTQTALGTWYEASKWNRMEWGVRESAKEKKNKREKMILNSVAIIFCFIGSTFIILFLVSCISQCVWRPSNVNFSFVSRTRISNLNGRVFHPPPRVLLRTRGLVHEWRGLCVCQVKI